MPPSTRSPALAPSGPGGGSAAAAGGPTTSPGPIDPNAAGGAPMVAEVNRLKGLLEEDARDLQALLRLANIFHDAAMWPEAVEYYERAVTITPDFWEGRARCTTTAGKTYSGSFMCAWRQP